MSISRRQFIASGTLASIAALSGCSLLAAQAQPPENAGLPDFRPLTKPKDGAALWEVGLAQWSLRDLLRKGTLDNRDFGRFAKEQWDIRVVEWVNGFFKDKATDQAYLAEMKKRCDDAGVRTNLIMIDGEGALGDPDEARRTKTIDNHKKWIEASKFLGGHAVRVNAQSNGSFDEQVQYAADGLSRLTDFAKTLDMTICVENHGGLSSNKDWLVQVMKTVNKPGCGILPDFGNCGRGKGETERYSTIDAYMPFAQSVSVKTWKFNADGSHPDFDITRLMRIVNSHGWHGVCSIESEGAPGGAEAVTLSLKAMQAAEKTLRAELGLT